MKLGKTRFYAFWALLTAVVMLVISACSSAAPAPASTSTGTAPAPTKSAAPSATQAPAAKESTSSGAKKELAKVSFGMIPSITTAPTYVALDKGYFKDEGIDLSIQNFPDTAQIMTLVATGKLQFGQITMGAAAFNSFARKTDMVMIASVNQEPAGHGSLMPVVVRKDLYDSGQVKSAADLKGKKVAINGKATVLEWALAKYLKTANLTINDVDFMTMPWPDMVTAMSNKALDAGMLAEPLATQAVQKGIAVKLADDYVPHAQFGTIFVNKVFAKENPQVVRDYLVAFLKSVRELNGGKFKNDQKTMDIITKYTKVPTNILKDVPAPYYDPNGRVNQESILDIQRYLLEQKAVQYTEPLKIGDILDESYLDQALKIAGTVPNQ